MSIVGGSTWTARSPDWLVELRGALGVDHGPANAGSNWRSRESHRLR